MGYLKRQVNSRLSESMKEVIEDSFTNLIFDIETKSVNGLITLELLEMITKRHARSDYDNKFVKQYYKDVHYIYKKSVSICEEIKRNAISITAVKIIINKIIKEWNEDLLSGENHMNLKKINNL